MSVVVAALRELMAAGLEGAALLAAVERIAAAAEAPVVVTTPDPVAERRRAYDRDRKARASLHRNSTGTPPEPETAKKGPPDPLKETTPSQSASQPESPQGGRSRGFRLPAGFRLTPEDRQFARDRGWTETEIDDGEAEFIDHWSNVPGAKGCKLDWSKTWRNRVRNLPKPKPAASKAPVSLAAPTQGETSGGRFYAMRESAQFEAWNEHRKRTEGRTYATDSRGGWWFPSEWPPPAEVRPLQAAE